MQKVKVGDIVISDEDEFPVAGVVLDVCKGDDTEFIIGYHIHWADSDQTHMHATAAVNRWKSKARLYV